MNIPKYEDLSVNSVNSEDPLEDLVTKYKNHPSIRAILGKSPNKLLLLKRVPNKDIEKEILNLNVAKRPQGSDILSNFLFKEFNKSIEICMFPSFLKRTNVTPVYKKRE